MAIGLTRGHAIAALKKDLPEFDAKPLLEEAKSKYSELFKQADEVVAASKKRIIELEQELKETAAAKVRSCIDIISKHACMHASA